jgi:hypothetical protein
LKLPSIDASPWPLVSCSLHKDAGSHTKSQKGL